MVSLNINEINMVDKSTQTEMIDSIDGNQFIEHFKRINTLKMYNENKIIKEYLVEKNRNSVLGKKINNDLLLEKETIEKLKNCNCEVPSWLLFRYKNKYEKNI